MPFYTEQQRAKVYSQFKAMDPTAFRTVIHFVEEHTEILRHFPFEQYLEMTHAYIHALFETGSYRSHYLKVDELIELVITYNIYSFRNEENLYETLLFQKAASAYQLMKYPEAIHILRELKGMNPAETLYPTFQAKCFRAIIPKQLRQSRALSMLFLLLSATIILAEILVIRPIWPMYTDTVMLTRNVIFGLGAATLAGGELAHRARSYLRAFNRQSE